MHYILDGHTPKPCDLMTWARFFEDANNRRVAHTLIGPYRVSTVFLGLDHNYCESGPPLLFETMSFGPEGAPDDCQMQQRYSTWDEAEAGHAAVVEWLRKVASG